MKIYNILLFVLCLSLTSLNVSAQGSTDLQVKGVVLDQFGETLPGANVFIKDQPGVGVVTNIDGAFTIRVPSRLSDSIVNNKKKSCLS